MTTNPIENILRLYGDLLFDLCESVLWDPANAQLAFRTILKEIKKNPGGFIRHERAWVLNIACVNLRDMAERFGRKLTSPEQIQLDAAVSLPVRLKQFDSYFHRLLVEDQLLLLFKDKYGLPYPEIATAMNTPEASLKIRRQQALRSLEEWLWDLPGAVT